MSIRSLLLFAILLVGGISAAVLLHNPAEQGSGPVAQLDLSEAELIERGRYLAIAGNCASCHTTVGGGFMAGGVAFETPFGRLYSTNITPDLDTGIGGWSEWDFLNAMRHGLRPDGEHLYPAFPYTAYTKVADEDIAALYAYFQSLPPVTQAAPDNEMGFPFNQRPLLAFWKLLYLDAGPFESDPEQSAQWNRGAYLVDALAHCSACHSPRNVLGAEMQSLAMSGGEYLDRVPGGAHKPWSAPNLTATDRGLGLWSQQELVDYLHQGRNEMLDSFGPMNEVIMNSTRFLNEADVAAMAVYLKSLPAVAERAPNGQPDESLLAQGRSIYNLHCGTCHLPSGEGDPELGARINRGSLVVQSDNPASMINAILYAPEGPGTALPPRWLHEMEEFQYKLSDQELAAVATYVRHSWDNNAGIVTAEQVAKQR